MGILILAIFLDLSDNFYEIIDLYFTIQSGRGSGFSIFMS
jgi:hypothetical protein